VRGVKVLLGFSWNPPVSKFRRIAPYFLIGPISGPLVAGVVINWRDGRRVLAGMYGVVLAQYLILLPMLTTHYGLTAFH
jgi:hypothetical protein